MGLFGPRCEHRWVEVHRDVQARKGHVKFGGGALPPQMDDLLYGCTHIELRCDLCGRVRGDKVRGEHPARGVK